MSSDYDNIEITDDKDRLFKAWGSVEIVDKDGELIPMSVFAKIMPKIMERGGVLIDNHTNRVVGRILNYEFRKKDGNDGLLLTGKVFDHFKIDDQVWNELKSGIRKGISFGGRRVQSSIKKAVDDDGKPYYILGDVEGYEFSIVNKPANPEATIEAVNMIAKGEEDVEKSGPSALRDMERDKPYGRVVKDDEPDTKVSISHAKDKWYVKDEKSGKVLGEHDTKEGALDQMKAIYSNDNKADTKVVEHDITEDNKIPEDPHTDVIEKIVKPMPDGNGWGVFHCHGKDKGKLIRRFKTKEEAERMHRAIMAHEYGGENMKKDDKEDTPAPEDTTPDGADETDADNATTDLATVLSAIVDKLDELGSKIDGMTKADDTKEDPIDEDEPPEPPKKKEDDAPVQKSAPQIDVASMTDEIAKALLEKIGVQSVETKRPETPEVKKASPEPEDADLALKVARGETKMTFEDIEHKKREAYLKKIDSVLED